MDKILQQQDPNIRKLMLEQQGNTTQVIKKPLPRKITGCKIRLWQGNPKPQIHWGYNEISRCNYTDSGHTSLFNLIKDNVRADYMQAHVRDVTLKSFRTEDARWETLVLRHNGAVKALFVVADAKHWGFLQQDYKRWDKPLRSPQLLNDTYYWDYTIKNMEQAGV